MAMTQLTRLLRLSLTTAHLDRLAAFYQEALGCRVLDSRHESGAQFEALMGVSGGARSLTLGLGGQRIELLQFERAGQPYPAHAASTDIFFQHFAIVVSDMDRALEQLAREPGWSSISMPGPQHLPASSGGVTAFKFRDPEGHPLELLAFAPGHEPAAWRPGETTPGEATPGGDRRLCLGIDHSAISVAETERSVAFYGALGLAVSARSLNRGPEQALLDDVAQPQVEVTALSLPGGGAHLELLCYRDARHAPAQRQHQPLRNNDVAATRLVLEMAASTAGAAALRAHGLRDPDGHHLLLLPPATAQNG
jgi:catechol 2,3-dioxygenase-like lactoylglutathione lyase family enzyme